MKRSLHRLLEVWFANRKWARRLIGGKWELWWVDHPVCSDVWHKVDEFTHIKLKRSLSAVPPVSDFHPHWWGYRPSPLCRGTPTLEDWGSK